MKDDHETRLAALAEKLAEAFMSMADPENMTAFGKVPKDLTQKERGDLAWDVKLGNGFGLLFARALELRIRVKWQLQADAGVNEPPLADLSLGTVIDPDAEIHRFEREAQAMLDRVGARRGK